MEVIVRKQVPENCSTCLYWNFPHGCCHADRQKDWMVYKLSCRRCPSWWLDHRFERA